MKKIFVLFLAMFLVLPAAAFAKSANYDIELSNLKSEKFAKDCVINTQINAIKKQIERVTIDESMSADERVAKLNSYQAKLFQLKKQKEAVRMKYKADKKLLN